MRVVIDTNVIISAFLSPKGAPAEIVRRWSAGELDVVVSRKILDEYRRVLNRPSIQVHHGLSEVDVSVDVEGFEEVAILVTPSGLDGQVANDPEDDKFLAAAADGRATYVVSGDSHLLDLREYRGIPILRPATFLAVLRESM